MKDNSGLKPSRELMRLMAQLIDGSLDDAGRASLRAELDRPGQMEAYRDLMLVHACLLLDLNRGRGEPTSPLTGSVSGQGGATECAPSRSNNRSPRGLAKFSSWMFPSTVGALAASLVLGVWLEAPSAPSDRVARGPVANDTRGQSVLESRPTPVEGVAVLAREVDSKGLTTPAGGEAEVGMPLEAGGYRLDRGLIQLEFFSGATVVVEGPARFSLVSAERMLMELGKARAHVPNQAEGFTIETPRHDVVDLGTEFAIAVDEGGASEVHVLDGEVELHNHKATAKPLLLSQGKAMALTDGSPTPVRLRLTSFAGQRDIHDAGLATAAGSKSKWVVHSKEVRSRKETLVYYDFDGQSDWSRVLPNASPASDERLDGAVVGCEWAEGRWPGKRALSFKRSSDRVRFHVPGEFTSLTMATWVRIEGFDRWLSSLMLTDGHQLGEVHWQLTNEGQFILGVKAEAEKSHNYFSPFCLNVDDLGRWRHIACVYDGEAGAVSHFLDGRLVSRDLVDVPTPLRIGDAQLGNWNPEIHKVHQLRSLNGRIDEFVMLSKPLAPGEIQAMYEAGRPY